MGGLRDFEPDAAAALQSIAHYVAYVAKKLQVNSTYGSYFDPLPINDHMLGWVNDAVASPLLFVVGDRAHEPRVFEAIRAHLALDSNTAKLLQLNLLKRENGANSHSDWSTLSRFQKTILTQHFSPLLKLLESNMSTGVLHIPGHPLASSQQPLTRKKQKKKKRKVEEL